MRNFLKNKILATITLFSLFSLGFSSWLIIDGHTSFDVDVKAGSVIDLKSIFKFNYFKTDGICSMGFVRDGQVINECLFTYNFSVNNDMIDTSTFESKTLNLEIAITCLNNISFLSENSVSKVLINDSVEPTSYEFSNEQQSNKSVCKCLFLIPMDEILSLNAITISYLIKNNNGDLDYKSLSVNPPKLNLELDIKGFN